MRIISAIYMSAYLTNSLHLLTKLSPYLAHQPTNLCTTMGKVQHRGALEGGTQSSTKQGTTRNCSVRWTWRCIAQSVALQRTRGECSGAAVSPPPALYIIGNRAAFPQNIAQNLLNSRTKLDHRGGKTVQERWKFQFQEVEEKIRPASVQSGASQPTFINCS